MNFLEKLSPPNKNDQHIPPLPYRKDLTILRLAKRRRTRRPSPATYSTTLLLPLPVWRLQKSMDTMHSSLTSQPSMGACHYLAWCWAIL